MNTIHWLGLDSYNEKEASLFFGRQTEIEELSGDIFHNQQTIIYGPSGVGKTSIIKAGIFTKARKKDFLPVYIRLSHNDDEISYSQQIISAICQEAKDKKVEIEQTVQYIDKNDISLWEFFHCNKFWSMYDLPVIPLFVIDQFEELFTLGKSKTSSEEFFSELADLCDNLVPKYVNDNLETSSIRIDYPKTVDYRLVLSLREDFLPRLEEYADHIPALKRNRYSLQAINAEQAMDIIMKPEDGLVNKKVAITIIEKVTNNSGLSEENFRSVDVEPSLLSLFCSVLDKKRIDKNESIISMELVNEFGENIIKDFYTEKISLISEQAVDFIEEKLLTDDGFRDSIALKDTLHKGKLTKDELDLLQKSRIIQIEDKNGTKRIEFTHDVLCKVAKEHRDNKKIIKEKEQEKKKLALERQKRVEIEQKAEKERINNRRKIKKLSYTIVMILIVIGCVIYGIYDGFYKQYDICYLSFTKQYGWPVGIGKELTKNDCERTSVYYRLSRKGRLSENPFLKTKRPFTCVETLNNKRELTENNDINIPLVDKSEAEKGNDNSKEAKFARLQSKACKWQFLGDSNGNFYKEIVYSKFGEVLYVYNITNNLSGNINNNDSDGTHNNKSMRGTYYDKDGGIIQLRDNGAQTILIAYDQNGYEEQYQFFDAYDNPCSNSDKAYGVLYDHDNYGRILSVNMLDQMENIMNPDSCSYNAMTYCYYGNSAKVKQINYFKLHKNINPVKKMLKDINGRDSVSYLYTFDGKLRMDTCAITVYKYKGLYCCEKECLTSCRQLWIPHSNNAYSRILYAHDNLGHIINKKYFIGKKCCYEERYLYEHNLNRYDAKYRMIAKDLMLSFQSIDYTASTEGMSVDERHTYDRDGLNTSISFYDIKGKKIFYNGYHEYIIRRTTLSDSVKIQIIKYIGTQGKLRNDGAKICSRGDTIRFAIDSLVYINNLLTYEYHKDKEHNIILSTEKYYDRFGNSCGQSVVGISGKPIRYGFFDEDGLNYYKLYIKGNFHRCINEFGEEDYIQKGDSYFSNGIWYEFPLNTPYCIYLSITSEKTNVIKDGLKDNDILLSLGRWSCSSNNLMLLNCEWSKMGKMQMHVKIARLVNGKYVARNMIVSKGYIYGLVKSVFYIKSNNEINRLKKL